MEDLSKFKLFVDDRRKFPSVGFECCRNAEDAIFLLSIEEMEFEYITLDYDLGYGESNGMTILEYMKDNDIYVPRINIHSNHSIGKDRMREFCKQYFPNSEITTNRRND